ncbi:MAG: ABC transporter permease [Oscillospiraceae bacterium]|nr:ABC transporter permease [Oscillospiraceae bacterium]
MPSYIVRRILVAIPVLFGITVITFLIINSLPGSPVDYLVDPRLPAEVKQAKLEMMGVTGPVWQQYLNWLKNLLQGNLGFSLNDSRPVLDVILERVGPTLLLMGSALVVGIVIAIPLGIVSAVKQYSALDYIATGLAFTGISMPAFFSGLALIYLFSVNLKWLPSGGMSSLSGTGGGGAGDVLVHLIMPACVVAIGVVGQLIRYVRAGMLRELDQDYVRTAMAKGVKPPARIFVHAFRNALLSIVTVIGMQIPSLFCGAVVAEQVFSWPGIGSLMSTAILARNYPVLMGLILFSAVVVLLANLVTDIVYAVVDPRVRLS